MISIVGPKKQVNPYLAAQIALVAAGYAVLLVITVIFWYLSLTFTGDPAHNGWWAGAIVGTIATLIATGVVGAWVYAWLEERANAWREGPHD